MRRSGLLSCQHLETGVGCLCVPHPMLLVADHLLSAYQCPRISSTSINELRNSCRATPHSTPSDCTAVVAPWAREQLAPEVQYLHGSLPVLLIRPALSHFVDLVVPWMLCHAICVVWRLE